MTAVEWLVQEINKINVSTEARRFISKLEKKAKEMEKQQIILSHINGQSEYDSQAFSSSNTKIAEQYYNETFNK